jgi:hypothetical protein
MGQTILALLASCALGLTLASAAQGAAVIESSDRLEINWTTLRLRYYGEATIS